MTTESLLAWALTLAGVCDLLVVMGPLRSQPALVRLIVIGFALVMLAVAGLLFSGTVKLSMTTTIERMV